MAQSSVAEIGRTDPVEDSVPKVDNAIAVGEDLHFQRQWWKFERGAWVFFGMMLLADALGCFGRGWVAKAERHAGDHSMDLKYERIERAATPSMMTVRFGQTAVRDGAVRLFVSDSIVRELGAQRVIPQPERSVIGDGGITYSFPASEGNITVQIALEPSFPGVHTFRMGVPDQAQVQGKIAVVP